jgi:hypothetical protein
LSVGTLDLYRKRVRLVEGGAGPKGGLVRVKLSAEQARGGSGLELVLSGGLRVEVGEGFDEETLKRLLAVIEQG